MATARKPSIPKTSAQLKAQLETAKAKVASLEKRVYEDQLGEWLKSTTIVKDFAAIQAKVKDISPLAILAAIAEAVGIKRLVLSQSDVVPRNQSAKAAVAK